MSGSRLINSLIFALGIGPRLPRIILLFIHLHAFWVEFTAATPKVKAADLLRSGVKGHCCEVRRLSLPCGLLSAKLIEISQ